MAIVNNVSMPFLGLSVADVLRPLQNSDDLNYFIFNGSNKLLINSGRIDDVMAAEYSGEDELATDLLMPTWAYRSTAAYLLFISILGLIMNIIVVIVILNDSQRMTPLNWMLFNLACSDGAIAGFGTPISTAAALEFGWPFSNELCVAYAMIMSTAGIGSITTLTALAIWRCQLVVCCPAKRKNAFTNHSGRLGCRQGVMLLIIIWIYALAITCPPLFGWGRYDREAAHISCSVNWESKTNNNRSYILYMFGMGLVVPLVIIIVSYARILTVVRKRRGRAEIKREALKATEVPVQSQQLTEHEHSFNLKTKQQQPHHFINNNQQHSGNVRHHRRDAAEKRVTMMVACMIAAFMAAWTPYSILALFETFIGDGHNYSSQINATNFSSAIQDDDFFYVGTISPAFATIPSLFAKTSAVLNPLIYGLLNTQFRLAWERFSLRFLGRLDCHQSGIQGESGHGHNHKKRRNMRRFLVNCYSDSHSLKPSPTVHLQMKEIIVPHVEHKVYDKMTQEQGSSETKITPIPALSSDNQIIISSPSSLLSNRYENQNNPKQGRQNKMVDQQNLLQPNHLSSLHSLSSPSSVSTIHSPCMDNLETTYQQMRSARIQEQQQTDSFVVAGLLSHSADCYHTGDAEKFVFLETTVNDLGGSLTARNASLKNRTEAEAINQQNDEEVVNG